MWVTVVLSGALVRGFISANDSPVPLSFPLAALWVVGAVCAVQWTVSRWVGRNG